MKFSALLRSLFSSRDQAGSRRRWRITDAVMPAVVLAACLGSLPAAHAQQSTDVRPVQNAKHGRVVGYYTEWGTYSGFNVKNLVTSGSAGVLSQINYAFASLQNGQCVSADPYADYQKALAAGDTVNGVADSTAPGAFAGNFHQLLELKKRFPQIKVVISIGGGSANPADFSVAAQPANRAAFVKSCVDLFLKGNFAPGVVEPGVFDGVDIDWEYPASAADKANLTGLLAEFRSQMNAIRPGMMLSIASSAGSWAYQYIDFVGAQKSLNFFDLMAYDFDGPWNSTTGFVAPLTQSKLDPDAANNAEAAVKGYLAAGVRPEKIVLGMPFYGYDWTAVPNVDHGLFQAGTPGTSAEYNQLVSLGGNFTHYRDWTTLEPYLYDGTTFWTYDDPLSLAYKTLWARSQHLGGVMAWELSGDTADGELIKTLAYTLRFPR